MGLDKGLLELLGTFLLSCRPPALDKLCFSSFPLGRFSCHWCALIERQRKRRSNRICNTKLEIRGISHQRKLLRLQLLARLFRWFFSSVASGSRQEKAPPPQRWPSLRSLCTENEAAKHFFEDLARWANTRTSR